jgi:hypothetical protein
MPYSHRVFCRDFAAPSLSEVLVWLRQHEYPAAICGGRSAGDLLSNFWDDVELLIDDTDAPLAVLCIRADAAGVDRLTEEVADFVADVGELPDSPSRARVLGHLAATRLLLVIEFPQDGGSPRARETAESIATLFVERAGGLAQRDGVGFLDEDDEIVLGIG